jgi:uroporphyrinogen-III synthase
MSGQIRILSTGPLEEALCKEAKEAGVALDTLPFIETRPLSDEGLGRQIRDLFLRPLIAVFTSTNGVEAVAGWLSPASFGKAGPALIPWTIYCIGGVTRQVIGKTFGEASIKGTADSAGALADLIIRDRNGRTGSQDESGSGRGGEEVFFFCGDLRRDELPSALRRASIGVNELIVYTTRQVRQEVAQLYDGVVFFSPSAVHSFFSNNKVDAATLLFAIGQTTADSIREYSSNKMIISPFPGKEALIRQVIGYYKQEQE